ncbi:MAG TPA: DUF3592 domain-containing protein [Pirellulales bacterium]
MQIVRNDSDVLVLQSRGGGLKTFLLIITAIVLAFALSAASAWIALRPAGPSNGGVWIGAALVAAAAAGIAIFSYVICEAMPLESCLAFDRHAREILSVRKTVLRVSRDVFAFDRVRNVLMEEIPSRHGVEQAVSLQLQDGRKIRVTSSTLGGSDKGELQELAAALRETLGFPVPESKPEAKKTADGWPVRIMRPLLGACLIGLGLVLGSYAAELWQSRSWPRTEAVVESLELGKKMKTGKHPKLTDAIDITYRYTIGDTVYCGTRFNSQHNWLSPADVPLVRQQYQPGSRCLVSYNPRNPARCYVRPDIGLSKPVVSGVVSLVLCLTGFGVVAYSLWKIARADSVETQLAA